LAKLLKSVNSQAQKGLVAGLKNRSDRKSLERGGAGGGAGGGAWREREGNMQL